MVGYHSAQREENGSWSSSCDDPSAFEFTEAIRNSNNFRARRKERSRTLHDQRMFDGFARTDMQGII